MDVIIIIIIIIYVKSGFYETFNISYIFITVNGIRVKRDR